jgi:predicted DNA-binding protein with PD1-like motif
MLLKSMRKVNAMINTKRIVHMLAFCLTATLGYSQDLDSEYVAPVHPAPRGEAPGMKVQLLKSGTEREYAVIFAKGDEAFSGLQEFAERYQIQSAHFTAIGALNGATLAWFDPQRKMYRKIPILGQVEVVSMIGDIALYQGKPTVHTHMVVGLPDGTTISGHVLDAHVSPTLEVMVTVDPIAMHKRFDPETDLTLIDPTIK